MHVHRLCSNYL